MNLFIFQKTYFFRKSVMVSCGFIFEHLQWIDSEIPLEFHPEFTLQDPPEIFQSILRKPRFVQGFLQKNLPWMPVQIAPRIWF